VPGIVDRYEKDLKTLKPEEQYIWHLRMEGNIKVVVTAHPTLAALIHGARYLICDYTFKRMNGELNEWEVAIWHAAINERRFLDSSFLSASDKLSTYIMPISRCDGGARLLQWRDKEGI
jgi:hypothetical protein